MIIYIDKEGRENIIRSDELIEKLITENIITENTLLKTEVAGDWIVASEFELFKKHNKIIEKIDDTHALMKEMQNDYNESLKDPVKINLFKDKWKAVSVVINDEDDTKLNESNEKFSTSNIWMVKINTTIRIFLGRNVYANLAAFLADNNRAIKENLSGLFEIQNSNELSIIKHPLLENKTNQISIINKGILGVPNPKINIQEKKNEKELNKTKEKENNIDKAIEDKFYVPKQIIKKTEVNDKKKSTKDEIKKEELNKSVPSSTTKETFRKDIKPKKMGFGESIGVCFAKYFEFKGRARRSEYWYFILFIALMVFFLELFEILLFDSDYSVASSIFYLFVFFPSIAVSVRRLHDITRTGWWLLISFLPIIGTIILLIFHINDSHKGENIYGKNPKF